MAKQRHARTAKVLQRVVAQIITQDVQPHLDGTWITVTRVQVTTNLGLAKFYLSFLPWCTGGISDPVDQAKYMALIQTHMYKLKQQIAHQLRQHFRRLPKLRFYADDSLVHTSRIMQLLEQLKATS